MKIKIILLITLILLGIISLIYLGLPKETISITEIPPIKLAPIVIP